MRVSIALLSLFALANAQFGFFDQMFGGHQEHRGHHHQQQGNNPSDPSIYHAQFEQSVCDKYLCPDSFACVHFPHHCPCVWDNNEDKFELAEGKRICVSKGGFKEGEAARKLELARKGLL